MFIKSLVSALNAAQIPYALVGGFAVSLHGAVRGTLDIDIIIPLEQEIYKKVEEVMGSIGLASRIPVSGQEVFNFRDEYIDKRNLKAWSFVNSSNPAELVDILIIYDLNKVSTVRKTTPFGDINVISLKDLIKIKREAGRPQDLADVAALEKLK